MSCTSVIFLVRLELSQGFNWNPDFKETLHPSNPPLQTRPTPPLLYLPWLDPLMSTHHAVHTDRDHHNI